MLLQELLVNELVAAVDALSREAASSLVRALLASAPLAVLQAALGPLRTVLPLPTPAEALGRVGRVVAVTEEDKEALQVLCSWGRLLLPLLWGACTALELPLYDEPQFVSTAERCASILEACASMQRP